MRPGSRTLIALTIGLASWAVVLPLVAAPVQAAPKRFDMLAMGVDMTPVGTSRQVERMKRMRRQNP